MGDIKRTITKNSMTKLSLDKVTSLENKKLNFILVLSIISTILFIV